MAPPHSFQVWESWSWAPTKSEEKASEMDLIHPRAQCTLDNLLLLKDHFQVSK